VGSVITNKPTAQRTNTTSTDEMDLDDDFGLNDSLEDTLKETNVTEL
jgi:hypothetical protein